jgi:hypothetical protein
MRAAAPLMRPMMPTFMSGVTTVIGDTIYTPGPADGIPRDLLARILAHELVHQQDQATYGLTFYATYGLLMPTGRTYRAHWERRAYAVDLMLAQEEGGEAGLQRALARIVPLFSGPAYGWMWAGQQAAQAYLAPVVDEVRTGTLQTREPYRAILAAWTGAHPGDGA